MNLTKLFNFKYFKENLKKSKGLVALLLIIVPIFTTLFTVLVVDAADEINVPSMTELIVIDILGMYPIPVLISLVLFGYVYKKKSVDFINSQPINRKTIFITNTIGGILLMALIQAITAICILICGALLPTLVIFPEMILDIFIMMWIAYSFTFVATNIAMSVSGTFPTQVVLTVLILFLLPFCIDCYHDFSNGINFEVINGEKTYNEYVNTDEYYTMPYQMFHMIFSSHTSEFNLYSGKIISRMLVLGVVYYLIGLHLFKNRKMENNEESFFNEKIHIFVKALTILPLLMLLNMADAGKEFNIIAIAIIITYYFIYDFCVKRKMKLKSSIIYLVLTMAVLQGVCSGIEKLKEATPMQKLNVDNIASVKFQLTNEEVINTSYISRITEMGGFIENEEIIKILFDSAHKMYYLNSKNAETAEVIEDVISIDTKMVGQNNEKDKRVYCDIAIKTKDGNQYCMNVRITQEDFDKIIKILAEDEKYLSKIKNSIVKNAMVTICDYKILENEEKEIVLSEIENKINTMSLEELRNMDKETETAGYFIKYYYKNHKLIGISLKDDITKKTLEIVSDYMNKESISRLMQMNQNEMSFKLYPKNKLPRTFLYMAYVQEDMYSFILENADEEFDVNKPYYVIEFGYRDRLHFYTNKVEEVENLINKEVELEYENTELDRYVGYDVFQ